MTIPKQAPGLFDYVNRMAELPVCVSHRQAGTLLKPWIDWIKSSIGRNFIRPWKKLSKARPRYEEVMMFKILVLHLPVRVRTQTGRYYHLSEEQTEYQIKDRLSFQKFLGLTLADAVGQQLLKKPR